MTPFASSESESEENRLRQPQADLRRDAAVVILLLIAAILVFGRALFMPGTNAFAFARISPDFSQFYGFEMIIRRGLAAGQIPIWNLYNSGGLPLLGDPQSELLYLPMALLRWLPIPAQFNVSAVLHPWLAGIGIYLLMRDLSVRRPAAALSAVAFMFSGMITMRFLAGIAASVFAITWPAWILWSYRRLLRGRSWWYLLATVGFVMLEVLAGSPPFIIYTLLIPTAYGLYQFGLALFSRRWADLAYDVALSAALGLLAAALLAVQILPTLEVSAYSFRVLNAHSLESMETQAVNPVALTAILAPYSFYDPHTFTSLGFGTTLIYEFMPYAGLATALLAVYALIVARKRERSATWFFGMVALAGILLALPIPLLHRVIYQIASFLEIYARFLFLTTFSISVLGGLGLNALLDRAEAMPPEGNTAFRWAVRIGTAISLMLLAGWAALRLAGDPITRQIQQAGYFRYLEPKVFYGLQQRNVLTLFLLMALLSLSAWLSSKAIWPAKTWGWSVVAILLVDMIIFAWPVSQPQPTEALYDPADPLAILSLDPAEVRVPHSGSSAIYGVPNSTGQQGRLSSARLEMLSARPESRGLKLLASDYEVSTEPQINAEMRLVEQRDGAYLYEHEGNLPRLYAAPAVHIVSSDDDALAFLSRDDFDPFAKAVVTSTDGQRPDLPDHAADNPRAQLAYEAYTPNYLRAHVQANQPVLVIFAEMNYPGWNAWIDGSPTRVWLANYAFRGVVVGAGDHVIEMRYQPMSITTGLRITVASLLIIVAISVAHIMRRNRAREARLR